MSEESIISKKSGFTMRKVLRVLSVLCIAFVFCPAFLVSCSGQEANIDVMTAVGGVSMYGEKVVEPHPFMLICLFIPIAVLIMLFIKRIENKKIALSAVIFFGIDFVIWFIFRATVKKISEENYCNFKTTGWFVLNVVVMLVIILLSVLILMKRADMENTVTEIFTGNKTVNVVQENLGEFRADAGFCMNCGHPLIAGNQFCTSCGTPIPHDMVPEKAMDETVYEKKTDQDVQEKGKEE